MKSMLSDRSCASSMMIVSYFRSCRSRCSSASRMPSVISFSRDDFEVRSVKRTW